MQVRIALRALEVRRGSMLFDLVELNHVFGQAQIVRQLVTVKL